MLTNFKMCDNDLYLTILYWNVVLERILKCKIRDSRSIFLKSWNTNNSQGTCCGCMSSNNRDVIILSMLLEILIMWKMTSDLVNSTTVNNPFTVCMLPFPSVYQISVFPFVKLLSIWMWSWISDLLFIHMKTIAIHPSIYNILEQYIYFVYSIYCESSLNFLMQL